MTFHGNPIYWLQQFPNKQIGCGSGERLDGCKVILLEAKRSYRMQERCTPALRNAANSLKLRNAVHTLLAAALRDFCFIIEIVDFLDFYCIWHLVGFGGMENYPTVCCSDLPTILEYSNMPQHREV